MKKKDIDRIIVLGERFTGLARKKLKEQGIDFVSREQDIIPLMDAQELYLKIHDTLDALCQLKCGHVPQTESECEGKNSDGYSCKVRRISDNAEFHFKQGWISLLKKDLISLLEITLDIKERETRQL